MRVHYDPALGRSTLRPAGMATRAGPRPRGPVTVLTGLSQGDCAQWSHLLEILDGTAAKWQRCGHGGDWNQPDGRGAVGPVARWAHDGRPADDRGAEAPRALLVDDPQPGVPGAAGPGRRRLRQAGQARPAVEPAVLDHAGRQARLRALAV